LIIRATCFSIYWHNEFEMVHVCVWVCLCGSVSGWGYGCVQQNDLKVDTLVVHTVSQHTDFWGQKVTV